MGMGMLLAYFAFSSIATTFCVSAQKPIISHAYAPHGAQPALTDCQRHQANIDIETTRRVQTALQFEHSNWANGSVHHDPFYTSFRECSADVDPGNLLFVQHDANTSAYTLPPTTSLARILYQTADLNGTAIPASAYVLFPYNPRPYRHPRSPSSSSKWPVVAWGHGTSGEFAPCAPSNIRNLWQQFQAPYALASQGYVVVAPDYAGLGVHRTAKGQAIPHQYLANPAHANDIVYAVQAAQEAYPMLSKEFVVIGHSQGGGAAWSIAQRQVFQKIDGYLGAIAAGPLTDLARHVRIKGEAAGAVAALMANYLPTLFPGFQKKDYLSEEGLKRQELFTEIEGCNSVAVEILPYSNNSLYQASWQDSAWNTEFVRLTRNGNQRIDGPLLVLQGDDDPAIPEQLTTQVVDETCTSYPDSRIEYSVYKGVSHVGILLAAQREWLDWIDDRFNGKPVRHGCQKNTLGRIPLNSTAQKELNWVLRYATELYETA